MEFFKNHFEVELPKLKPLAITPTREIRRRQIEENLRKTYGVNKTKTATAIKIQN